MSLLAPFSPATRRLRSPLLASIALLALSGCGESARQDVIAPSEIVAVSDAMRAAVAKPEVAGAVTMVVGADRVLHASAVGLADRTLSLPMRMDSLFWIASMTKPVTGVAIMMMQDAGKLSVDDPVAKYIPELAGLKTADGTLGNLTLRHLLTHTSGMGEVGGDARKNAHTLAELMPLQAAKNLQFTPGSKWQYCQSGINTLGRIVEIVSGQSFPEFLHSRLFGPLGMIDTTFYPDDAQRLRIAKTYKLDKDILVEAPLPADFDPARTGRVPAPNGGLFSTAPDYARFCQMLINRGTLNGKRYLSEAAVTQMATISTGDIVTGFTPGNGWGLGSCVIRQPQGVSEMLSPGTFGHGGAFGTQAWIDPVTKRAYILMVQRAGFPNSDNSDVRKAFQTAAVNALK